MPDRPSPSLDPAELLAQRAWMRRFAAALAGAEGEDLVQDAWVRVLSARSPALTRPRAWLASVMRNAARMRRRGAVRREQREAQAAREEALASTDELAAEAELEQLAVRAVLALSEPYRQALLLRYWRGLEPSEIARHLELPPATVRSHIARGLAEVRAELDRRHGRREAWVALLAPGAVVRNSTAAAAVGGGVWMSTMSTKWIVGATALAAASLWVGRLNRPHELREPESSAASASELAASAPLASEPMADPSAAEATERQPVQPSISALSSTSTELLVHVTWARDGSPTADVPLRVVSSDVEPYSLETIGTTDASGTVRFEALPPGEQQVDTLRDASGSAVLVPGEPQTLELAIPLALGVDCHVVDRDGAGVAGAEVWLSDFGDGSSGIVVGRTDAGGHLALSDVPGQHRSLAAWAPGYAPSTQREFRGQTGARIAVELVLPGPGASLAGVVRDASGTPLAGAEVLVGAESPGSLRRADGQSVAKAPPRHATSDADGSFLVHGLAPGRLELQARAPGYATAHGEVELAPDETGRCTLVLPPEASVAGVARDGGGRPLAGVLISGGDYYFDYSGRVTRTAVDGSFDLRGLEAGRCFLDAGDGDMRGYAATELELRSGEEARWDIVLTAGPVVAGAVLDERGAPLAHWHVAAVYPADPGIWQREAYSDSAGRFRMENLAAATGSLRLELRAPEEEWGLPVLVLEDYRVGDESLVLRAMDACRPSAFLSGRLVAADGAPLGEVELIHVAVGMPDGITHVPDADGRFRIGPLRSGEYELYAEQINDERAAVLAVRPPRFALQAGETKDVGELVMQRCGWIHVRAVAQGGGPLPAGTDLEDVELRIDGEVAYRIGFDDLQVRSEPLGPGTYLVRARQATWWAPDTEVEVRSGETTEVELAFERRAVRGYVVVFGDGAPATTLEVRLLDAQGRAFDQQHVDGGDVENGRHEARIGGLLPGVYSIEVRAADGRSATGELRVLDLAEDDTPLVLTLR